jgi:hypothetical protein
MFWQTTSILLYYGEYRYTTRLADKCHSYWTSSNAACGLPVQLSQSVVTQEGLSRDLLLFEARYFGSGSA